MVESRDSSPVKVVHALYNNIYECDFHFLESVIITRHNVDPPNINASPMTQHSSNAYNPNVDLHDTAGLSLLTISSLH